MTKKIIAEQCNSLRISWFKKHGLLTDGLKIGFIKWKNIATKEEQIMNFIINIGCSDGDSIDLNYSHTNKNTLETENINYIIRLTSTPCTYGGKRYWFRCGNCAQRVGILFKIGRLFYCRRCENITYFAQTHGGQLRGYLTSLDSVKKARDEIGRYYYNGKPTRKFKRFIRIKIKHQKELLLRGDRIKHLYSQFSNNKK